MGHSVCWRNRITGITVVLVLFCLTARYPQWGVADHQAARHWGSGKRTVANPALSNFIEEKLSSLVADLGVSSNNIPADFVDKVLHWAHLYQTRDRDEMERVLISKRRDFEAIRQQVTCANLPWELAFITLVESHFVAGKSSASDNVGLWQFTRDTARRNGLKVDGGVDERLDPRKSTEAACRYISRLMRHLGPDSSLLLAVAAYNMGPSRLQQRTRQLPDPSNRSDFWHLYRARVLPALTRTHIARLMAAILIGRHPERFGFSTRTLPDLETEPSDGALIGAAVSPRKSN